MACAVPTTSTHQDRTSLERTSGAARPVTAGGLTGHEGRLARSDGAVAVVWPLCGRCVAVCVRVGSGRVGAVSLQSRRGGRCLCWLRVLRHLVEPLEGTPHLGL